MDLESGPDARPSPDPPGGTRPLNSDSQTPKVQQTCIGAEGRHVPFRRPARVRRVVPLPRAPGGAFGAARPAAGAKPARAAGVSSNGSKSPPPEPPPLLTAGERGSLAPRTGGSLYPLTSALSRTLRVRRRRAARPAALRSSARTRHAPRPSSRSIVLRRRVNVRLFPGRAAQGHHNPPQSTTIHHNPPQSQIATFDEIVRYHV